MNKFVAQGLRYAALPGIVPRLKDFNLNFGYLAYLMALIFNTVRLLPVDHPYLLPVNMGRYSVREVMAAAAHNLKGGVRNIDQYIIFAGFMIGVVLLFLQFAILFGAIMIHSANAAIPVFGLFHTAYPGSDVAFLLLDTVFQIPDAFNSAAAPANAAAINPFAAALHTLFAFYSRGILIIAVIIIAYYMFVMVVESAQTGHPFGERLDSVYVPIRLILAIGLLMPIHYGLNGGQHLTLLVAKWGSGFATNAWRIHNNITGTNPLGLTTREMVVTPKIEDIGSMISFFELAHACEYAYRYQYGKIINAYVVKPSTGPAPYAEILTDNYANTLTFTNNGSIKVVFGEQNAAYTQYEGNVKPYCGSIGLQIQTPDLVGVEDIYDTYFTFFGFLWYDADISAYGNRTALINYRSKGNPCGVGIAYDWGATCQGAPPNCVCKHAGSDFYNNIKIDYQTLFEVQMQTSIDTLRASTPDQLNMTNAILNLGWGGAGVWFNRMSEFNGAVVAAAMKVPQPVTYPAVMEYVLAQKKKNQKGSNFKERYTPNVPEGKTIDQYWQDSGLDNADIDMGIAKYLDDVYRRISGPDLVDDPAAPKLNKNSVMNFINYVFGYSGLAQFRNNTDVHPMSRISALGRAIIEKSITFLGGSLVLSGFGGVMGAVDASFSKGFDLISKTMATMGMSALTVGFIFYYLVPFMPFMYFFFAVARWVKTIFEAMVGVPLWALAHLKIDGPGIPAQAAANGYFLLLEIMIRPILSLFGLMAAFSIFAALVTVLDTIFNVVVSNVGGYDVVKSPDLVDLARGVLDQFIYTIVYVIIVYMIATSSFKLIDLIPNGILRFAGAGVSSFGDKAPDPMESMVQYTAISGYAMTDSMANAVTGIGRAGGQAVGGLLGQGGRMGGASAVEKEISRIRESLKPGP